MNEYERLSEIFPEIVGAVNVNRFTKPSYNDGGSEVFNIWNINDKFYRTRHSDWGIHPNTADISQVKPETQLKWVVV